MTAVLHALAIALSAGCLVASLFFSRHRMKVSLWGDAVMVVAMVASVLTEELTVALIGASILVIIALAEAVALRRSKLLSDASRDNIIHRFLCFISMAFLLIVMHQHPVGAGSSHAHSGVLIPAMLALTGAALLMAMIMGVRQLRLLLATDSGGQAITHYVIESGGMVAATALMLTAALIGH